MEHNIRKELKILAKRILDDPNEIETESLLVQCREMYEKLVVLYHIKNEENAKEELQILEDKDDVVFVEPEQENGKIAFSEEPETDENDRMSEVQSEMIKEPAKQEEIPLSLNDLFVPTFEAIKEDMSQKDEFKDTISLDETENLFVTKRKESKQLSLNDKLLGSNIQVGLNDRIAFVNKLFNFSQSDFAKVLSNLNECNSRDEAVKYFEYQVKPNYNWKGKEDLEERLMILIERKFN